MNKHTPFTRIGTVGFDGPRKRTFKTLGCVEFGDSFRGQPGRQLLKRLRREAGEAFTFVMQSSCVLGHSTADPITDKLKLDYLGDAPLPPRPFDGGVAEQAAWAFTRRTARTLDAAAILLRTSAAFQPTVDNLDRLGAFVGRAAEQEGPPIIWDCQGLWETQEYIALCQRLALIPCLDPLMDSLPAGLERAYLRVVGQSRGQRGTSSDDRYRIAEIISALPQAWVVFHTVGPYRDAVAMHKFLSTYETELGGFDG